MKYRLVEVNKLGDKIYWITERRLRCWFWSWEPVLSTLSCDQQEAQKNFNQLVSRVAAEVRKVISPKP